MGAEFQNQFMDAMREAEVTDIKADLAKLKDSSKFDLPHFNPVQDIRREMTAAVETAPATAALPSTLSIVSPDRVHAGSEEPPKIEAPRTFDPLPSPAHESQNAVSQPPALFDESGAKISPPETQAGV
jgi:sec-independent protein translocase protein TatB